MHFKESTFPFALKAEDWMMFINFLLIGFYILTVIFRTLRKCPKSVTSTRRAQKPYYRRTLAKTNLSVSCEKKTKETNCFNRFVIKSREQMKLTVQMCSTDSCIYGLCIVRDSIHIHMRAEEYLPPLF